MSVDTLPEAKREKIESFVTDWLSDNRIPGAAVGIVKGSNLIYGEGFGARNLKTNQPATAETLYGIGSCTKSFTAIAIMQLVERDELAVSDSVNEYLPHLSDAPGDEISIRELLTHTSGMPSDGSAMPLISRLTEIEDVIVPLSSAEDFQRHVQQSTSRRVTDRETYFYYNSGYTMLGKIIEEVSGTTFSTFVRENILDPLQMKRSTFSRDDFRDSEDYMTPYLKKDEETIESDYPFDEFIHPAGGLLSSASEMANYLRMFLGGGTFDGADILSKESIDEMTTPVSSPGEFLDGRDHGYGYGIGNQEFLGERLIRHGGTMLISTAWFGYLTDSDLGVVLACASTPDIHPSNVGPGILALLKGEKPADSVPHYMLMEKLEAVTGNYTTYRDVRSARLTRDGGMLKLDHQSGFSGPVDYLKPETIGDQLLICSTVAVSGKEQPVRFELNDDGVDLYYERAQYEKEN